MIKAVLFDFDGVLTTDANGSMSVCKYISTATGLAYDFVLEAYRRFNRDLLYGIRTHADIWDDFCRLLGADIDIKLLHDSFINTPIDADMERLGYRLKNNGYKIGMITDNRKDRIDAIVKHRNLSGLFDVIAISASVGSGKNSGAIFKKALADISLEADECVFIDNNHDNLAVPRNMGMNTIFYDDVKRDILELEKRLSELGVKL